MKITIIGSMKFYPEFEKLKQELEKQGHEIIIPLSNEFYEKSNKVKKEAMRNHQKNIETSDAILVANFNKNNISDYIGINSIMEIGIAFNKNKKIFILNNTPKNCKEELEAIEVIELKGDLNNLR